MKEEGMTDTANKLIHIGKPIEINEMDFFRQLHELKETANHESPRIKECVQSIVPTYIPQHNMDETAVEE